MSPRRVLLIEDEEPFAQMLQQFLGQKRFAVDVAFDGLEGLERLDSATSAERYDAVLLDYIVPKLTGLDLLRKLVTRINSMPPIVVLTGKGSESVAVEMMKLGAADYIVKDAGKAFLDALPQVLNDAIAQREARRKKKTMTQRSLS